MTPQELINQIATVPFDPSPSIAAYQKFITDFPEDKLTSLTDQQYNGNQNHDSFCHNLVYTPNLSFGMRSINKESLGNKANPVTTKLADAIKDAKNGHFARLRERHNLTKFTQISLLKVLTIYLPNQFITVGQEYILYLLAEILGLDRSDDLIELNHNCLVKLTKENPAISQYPYNQLGSAIWSLLYPKYQKEFEEWLGKEHGKTGTKSSYKNCITYLSYHFCENLYSDNVTLATLQSISEDTLKNQREEGGTFYGGTPSYGKNGHYSAAVNEYIQFRFNPSNSTTPEMQSTKTKSKNKSQSDTIIESKSYFHNIILYGPPGTGKTYNTIRYAVSIINGYDVKVITDNDFVIDGKSIKKHYDEYLDNGQIRFTTFHQSLSYEDFIEGIKPEFNEREKVMNYPVKPGLFKEICIDAERKENKDKKYVLIIDEINRGNVAQIFGELITLIEEDKRKGAKNALSVTLPYSPEGPKFTVPSNLYILGTMNTADRSVEALDSALRRRFKFIEMMPNSDIVPDVINGINRSPRAVFKKINERIEVLKDSEHQIGHSYFMNIKTIEDLMAVFRFNIIPLLKEYFFGDMERIKMVIGDGFFETRNNIKKVLFPDYKGDVDFPEEILQIWGDAKWVACEKDPNHSEFKAAIEALLK